MPDPAAHSLRPQDIDPHGAAGRRWRYLRRLAKWVVLVEAFWWVNVIIANTVPRSRDTELGLALMAVMLAGGIWLVVALRREWKARR